MPEHTMWDDDHDGHTVSVPSARQLAIEAMDAWAQMSSAGDLVCVHADLLDAIPAHVLARLAIERGGLERCGLVDADDGAPLVFISPDESQDYLDRFALAANTRPVYRLNGGDDA